MPLLMTPKSPETKSRGLENMTGRPRVVMDVGTERMDTSERTKLQKTEGSLNNKQKQDERNQGSHLH